MPRGGPDRERGRRPFDSTGSTADHRQLRDRPSPLHHAQGRLMTPTKSQRHNAILEVVNRGSVHTQQDIAHALARRGVRATQATISRDIQELGLGGGGWGSGGSASPVREPGLSTELSEPVAVIRTPPGTANLVARRIDE